MCLILLPTGEASTQTTDADAQSVRATTPHTTQSADANTLSGRGPTVYREASLTAIAPMSTGVAGAPSAQRRTGCRPRLVLADCATPRTSRPAAGRKSAPAPPCAWWRSGGTAHPLQSTRLGTDRRDPAAIPTGRCLGRAVAPPTRAMWPRAGRSPQHATTTARTTGSPRPATRAVARMSAPRSQPRTRRRPDRSSAAVRAGGRGCGPGAGSDVSSAARPE